MLIHWGECRPRERLEKHQEISSIEHVNERKNIVVDFSRIEQPPNTIYHSTEITMQNINSMKGFGIVEVVGFTPNLILEYALKMEYSE